MIRKTTALVAAFFIVFVFAACNDDKTETKQQTATEIIAETARVAASQDDGSVEAKNVGERIYRTNESGHLQYLYLISPFDGKVIFRATVVGKTTSRGKRLEPSQVYKSICRDKDSEYLDCYRAFEREQPDGTYGPSSEGLFWFDTAGLMHEVNTEGAIILIEERPYVFPDDTINLQLDIRLQGQLEPILEAQRIAIEKYIAEHPEWEPGEPIPLEILRGSTTPTNEPE